MTGWIRDHFDKLLMLMVATCFALLVLHMSHDSHDAGNVNWAREQASLALGALIGLVTGNITRRNQDPPKDLK